MPKRKARKREVGPWEQTWINVRAHPVQNAAILASFATVVAVTAAGVVAPTLGVVLLHIVALTSLAIYFARTRYSSESGSYRTLGWSESAIPSVIMFIAIVIVIAFAFRLMGLTGE